MKLLKNQIHLVILFHFILCGHCSAAKNLGDKSMNSASQALQLLWWQTSCCLNILFPTVDLPCSWNLHLACMSQDPFYFYNLLKLFLQLCYMGKKERKKREEDEFKGFYHMSVCVHACVYVCACLCVCVFKYVSLG